MAKQVKKRIFAGAVCDQVIYQQEEDGTRGISLKNPKPRFKNEAEREAHKLAISRRHHALLINATFGPTSYFSTLTFNDANEVYDFKDARRIRDNYYRRLQYACPDAKIAIYMGRGRSTARIHFHLISDGIPEEIIKEKWTFGEIRECRRFREHNIDRVTRQDHGHDYTNVANYCFDHWTPEQGTGKRYKHTNNFTKIDEEKAELCIMQYSAEHPPRPPKGYIYTGDCFITSYGYMRFRYVIDPRTYPRN